MGGSPDAMARVVAVGGGHGLSRTLLALRRLPVALTAVVAMADDGGSSGRLRRTFGVPPPGDLRKALSALVPDEELARWLEYRFRAGELAGHSLGNLMLVALEDQSDGDLVGALRRLGSLLGATGTVLPSTLTPVGLVADGPDGEVRGQAAISRSSGHETVRLDPPDVVATPDAVAAIMAADIVVLGPGSLYTSILPNLLVPGIATAFDDMPGQLLLVANLREQPGETTGLTLTDHLDVLQAHLPGRPLDTVLVHAGPAPDGPGAPLSPPDTHGHVGAFLAADLLDGRDGHDPAALASAIGALVSASTRPRSA